jgi:hypothetical protein
VLNYPHMGWFMEQSSLIQDWVAPAFVAIIVIMLLVLVVTTMMSPA